MTDPRIHGPIGEAYAAYDSDPRVHGPDGFEAFADAVEGYGKALMTSLIAEIRWAQEDRTGQRGPLLFGEEDVVEWLKERGGTDDLA